MFLKRLKCLWFIFVCIVPTMTMCSASDTDLSLDDQDITVDDDGDDTDDGTDADKSGDSDADSDGDDDDGESGDDDDGESEDDDDGESEDDDDGESEDDDDAESEDEDDDAESEDDDDAESDDDDAESDDDDAESDDDDAESEDDESDTETDGEDDTGIAEGTDKDDDSETDEDTEEKPCEAPYECRVNCESVEGAVVVSGICEPGPGGGERQCCDLTGEGEPDTDGDTEDDTESDSEDSTDDDTGEDTEEDTDVVVGEASGENSGADCNVSAGEYGGDNPNLPDPFTMNNGDTISTMDEWRCRRNEIKKDLEEYEIGPKPEPPQVEATYSGQRLSVKVTTDAGSITLTSNVSGSGSCVVIGMDGTSSMVSGCTQVPFSAGQVVQVSMMNSDQPPNDPYYTVYPELWEEAPNGESSATQNGNVKIGNYSAWSWGISRLIDGLEQVGDQMGIDTSKIAVHGCSYAGKMALFAGALDERIALTIAHESGGGGIPAWRLSEDFNQRTGTDVEKIDNTNWSWFKDSMLNPPLEPHKLPHDHHELIAMVAPRAFVALGNPTQSWLSDESGYKSLMAAQEVWKAMGIDDKFGFDFNTTQGHCSPSSSQTQTVNAFVNRFLKDQNADTDIENPPSAGGFDLNWEDAVDWDTPTIQ